MTETRIFYAHAKAQGDFLREDAEIIAARWRVKTGTPVRVAPGRDDYDQAFATCGRSWDRWIARWATGTRLDGEPHYHVAVVPDVSLGRATAQGLIAMLAAGKPVIYWNRADQWLRVERVVVVNEKSWTAYGEIVTPDCPPLLDVAF